MDKMLIGISISGPQTASGQKGEHLLHESLESNSRDNTCSIYQKNKKHDFL